MIYKAGTVQVTRGSTTVTGNSTEFLKYVSSFSMFRRTGDTSTYIVDRVISQTELLLSTPYQGVSYEDSRYSINPDRTTNLGLPLLSPSLPDPSFVVNQALEKIDKNAGTFLDFNSLPEVDYSGETGFYIRGDYHSDELKLGRVIKLIDSSDDVISYDYVSNNSFFDADVLITPLAQDVYYSGETGAEEQLSQWDVLSNSNTAGYVFVSTVDTTTNHIVVSGEKVGSDWSADDELRCYGHTMGLGKIDTGLTTTVVPLTNVSGESLNTSEFKTNDLLYNYQRNSSRAITVGEVASLTTTTSTDDWAVGDTVYTIKADITVATPNVGSDVESVEYGAQSQIGSDSIKKANIDFGMGSGQVWAEDIPVSASPLDATNVNDAFTELNTDFINHTTTGEAHLGNDVHFADDGQGAHVLTSVHMQDAVNEVKNRINVSDFVTGAVDYSEDVEQFYSYGFINYPNAFMNSGERWCRMETGTNAGYVRKLDSFDNGSGEFNFASGSGFTYVPAEGDVFSVILTSELTGLTGDQGIQGEQGIQGDQGIQGEQGIQGDQGIQGEQGIQGNNDLPDILANGPGYWFDGVDDYVNTGTNTLSGFTELSAVVCFNLENIDADRSFISVGQHDSTSPFLMWADFATVNHYAVLLNSDSAGPETFFTDDVAQLGKNTVLCATFKSEDAVEFYINGKPDVNNPQDASTIDAIKTRTNSLYVGYTKDFSGHFFSARLFNTALDNTDPVDKAIINGGAIPYKYIGASQTVITAGSFAVGKAYKIVSVGTTDFTLIGSDDSVIGTEFTSTGVGAGTGTATQIGCVLDLNPTGVTDSQWLDNSGNELHGTVSGALPTNLSANDVQRYRHTVAITDDTTWTDIVPAGYMLETITFVESAGNAATIDLGTTSGASDVFSQEVIAASGITVVTIDQAFSMTAKQSLYLNDDGVGTWNSASLTATLTLRRLI